MKTFRTISLVSLLFITLLLAGCAALAKLGKSPYEGKWSYTLDTPQGVYEGFLTIIKDGKVYSGTMSANGYETDLRNLTIEDGKLSAVFDAEGFTFDFTGEFKEDVFTGSLITPDFSLPFTAKKVED
jgi:outer membrane protein assembly factor BamB